ncbi:50S ribosomal protein L20 [Candidatus Wolfebacteria bacterium]|nr:50S ribosomal protein L20 [Candidatus Wolfebacteria bacterium]
MTRVKRGTIAHKKREKILKYTKGFRWGRKSKERAAKEALLHAWSHAFQGRKQKKRDYRALWQTQINAAARANETTYSKLIAGLKKAKIKIDRKILAEIAKTEPKIFEKIVAKAK